MKEDKQDKSNNNEILPPTSYPSAEDETTFPVPPPQIEGYKILGELGKAGQGRVWRALQLSTHREVALKVPRAGLLNSEKSRARFEREVEVAARLKHPNIARIHDSGIHRDRYYYTMELIKGVSLNEYVERHNLTQRQVLELMRTVCRAVQHAHQNAVIHRDIKPSNILVTEDGQPHIVDFGLAKYIPGEDLSKAISVDGEMVGTPAYMSPEQALGEVEKVDTRTDVYSLGAILFVLSTGKNPHDLTGSRSKVLQRIAQEEIRRPRKINPKIDKELEALLLKSLDKDPDKRYASAGELTGDIDNYLNGRPLMAKAPTLCYFLCKQVHKYRRPIVVICLLIVTFVLGVIFPWLINTIGREKERAEQERQFQEKEEKSIIESSQFDDKAILRLTFGVYPSDKPSTMHILFGPLVKRIRFDLEQLLERPVYIRFELFPSYDDGIDAIVNGDVDFVRFGPSSYIIGKARNPGIQLFAMEEVGKEEIMFDGVIAVRKDSDINTLSDLRNRRFAFGDRNSTIGRYLSQATLKDAGIHAHELGAYAYLSSHDAVAEGVVSGQFDAGAMKESTYEKHKEHLRVIKRFKNVTKPWIARKGLDSEVVAGLQKVFEGIKNPEGLEDENVSGFTAASDYNYDFVRKRMRVSAQFFPWWYVFIHNWHNITATLILVGSVIYFVMTYKKKE